MYGIGVAMQLDGCIESSSRSGEGKSLYKLVPERTCEGDSNALMYISTSLRVMAATRIEGAVMFRVEIFSQTDLCKDEEEGLGGMCGYDESQRDVPFILVFLKN